MTLPLGGRRATRKRLPRPERQPFLCALHAALVFRPGMLNGEQPAKFTGAFGCAPAAIGFVDDAGDNDE